MEYNSLTSIEYQWTTNIFQLLSEQQSLGNAILKMQTPVNIYTDENVVYALKNHF